MEDRREEEGEAKRWKGCDLMMVYDEGEWIEGIKEERSEESEGLGGTPSGFFPLQGVVPWWRTPQTQWPLSESSTHRNTRHYFHLAGMTLSI